MTFKELRQRIDALKRLAETDDEAAHSAEDAIHLDVLRAIATGRAEVPQAMARIAAATADIKFARWSA